MGIDFAKPTWDLFVILFFVAASFVFGLSMGRGRIIVVLVSLYMTMAVMNYAPFLKEVNLQFAVGQVLAIKVTTFMTIFIGLVFMLSRSALVNTIAASDDEGSWWQVLLFSFFLVGLLITTVLSYLDFFSIEKLGPMAQKAFGSDLSRFCWVIAPILAMVVLRKKKDKL